MGMNGWRTAHNAPKPALLDAADRMGFLDENHRNGQQDDKLTTLVLRDRNHPSIVLWSIFNELLCETPSTDADFNRSVARCSMRWIPSEGALSSNYNPINGPGTPLDVQGKRGGRGSCIVNGDVSPPSSPHSSSSILSSSLFFHPFFPKGSTMPPTRTTQRTLPRPTSRSSPARPHQPSVTAASIQTTPAVVTSLGTTPNILIGASPPRGRGAGWGKRGGKGFLPATLSPAALRGPGGTTRGSRRYEMEVT